jgi:dTMP kinase
LNGLFVVFDGPSGSGKSTLINSVQQVLSNLGLINSITKEPTPRFGQANEDCLNGLVLFNLLLNDRRVHLEMDVLPLLNQGHIVLCDRYVVSSLVYQRIDGLDLEFIWSKNSHFLIPDLSVLVYASENTLRNRLAKRHSLTRFENEQNRKNELAFYLDAVDFLQNQGYLHIIAKNEEGCFNFCVDQVVTTIQGLINEKSTSSRD